MSYDDRFYTAIAAGALRSAQTIVPAVAELVRPASVLDVGCGTGAFATEFALSAHCEVHGVDGERPLNCLLDHDAFTAVDLAVPLELDRRFDLTVCLEVAEHLPLPAAPVLIESLVRHAPVCLFSAAFPGQGGEGHCFPAGTVVSGPKARGSFARRYEGPLVRLAFASGKFLTATPNHPVLTPHGWVAAGLLDVGRDVVRCLDGERITVDVPDEYQVPALIEDVAATVGKAVGVGAVGMPVTAEHFHGDGGGSEVAVVRTDRLLRHRRYPAFCQPGSEHALRSAGMGAPLLTRERPQAERLHPARLALDVSDERIGDPLSGFGRTTLGEHAVRLPLGAGDASANGYPRDRPAADTEAVADLLRHLAGHVSLDHVVDVERLDSRQLVGSGTHVFNLSTGPGWYVADGVIVHNCNERWPDYWLWQFAQHGWTGTGAIRFWFWGNPAVEQWYQNNLCLMAGPDAPASVREWIALQPAWMSGRFVNPGFWADRMGVVAWE